MKKLFALTLAVCIAVSLAACAKSDSADDSAGLILNGSYIVADEAATAITINGQEITELTFEGDSLTYAADGGAGATVSYEIKGGKLTFGGHSLTFDKDGGTILVNGVAFGKKPKNADNATADNKSADSTTLTSPAGSALPDRPDSCVADLAGVLGDGYSESAGEHLFPWIESIDEIVAESLGGSRLYIATVPTLDGEDVTSYATRLLERWKAGGATSDYNMLLLLAPNEKRAAFATGEELKAVLSGNVVNDWFNTPFSGGYMSFWDYFNAGEYVEAIGAFVDHLEDDWLYDLLDRGKSDGGTSTAIEDTAYPTIYKSTIAELHKRILTKGMKNAFGEWSKVPNDFKCAFFDIHNDGTQELILSNTTDILCVYSVRDGQPQEMYYFSGYVEGQNETLFCLGIDRNGEVLANGVNGNMSEYYRMRLDWTIDHYWTNGAEYHHYSDSVDDTISKSEFDSVVESIEGAQSIAPVYSALSDLYREDN